MEVHRKAQLVHIVESPIKSCFQQVISQQEKKSSKSGFLEDLFPFGIGSWEGQMFAMNKHEMWKKNVCVNHTLDLLDYHISYPP